MGETTKQTAGTAQTESRKGAPEAGKGVGEGGVDPLRGNKTEKSEGCGRDPVTGEEHCDD